MWQQFRRRRVTRTTSLYLALAFLVVEVSLSVASRVPMPDWGIRVVLGAAVLGFPLTVVLAWTYDVTPKGIVRTPDGPGPEAPVPESSGARWLIVSGGALLAAVILHLLRN